MSIRYKIFGAFSVVIMLACCIAFYGIRAIGNSGDMVVRLYDGPLMGINHARSAHAGLHDARLLLQRGLVAGSSGELVTQFESLMRSTNEDLNVVRERIAAPNVTATREKVEAQLKDWSGAVLKILKPSPGGTTEIPTSFLLAQQGDKLMASIDDLVELVAAYGYDYRTAAEGAVESARTTMLSIAVGTVAIGLIIALAFSYSMSRPISAAVRVAERVAAGNFADDIVVRRRDELGRLLKSLAVMQASLKIRADDDLAVSTAKDQSSAEQTNRRQRLEAEIDAFRSAFSTVLSHTARMTGELTDTAQSLASTSRAAGTQSNEAASTAKDTSANVQTVATAATQLGQSVQAITAQLADATTIVQRASGMGGIRQPDHRQAGERGAADRRGGRLHQDHRRPDQSARAQRHDRSGAGWRGGQGLCSRRLGGEGAGDADGKGHGGDFVPDHRGAVGDPAGGRECRCHRADHRRHRRLYRTDRGCGRPAE
ncbi:methyl-accepting chemotaxis protein [Bradyrhizobium diazoefficiens]|nr:methyl-accepting chemotaxis protein [Bradyrhizobium diazoefficiens]